MMKRPASVGAPRAAWSTLKGRIDMSEGSTKITDADILEAGARLLGARKRKAELVAAAENMEKVLRQMRREVEEAGRTVGEASARYDALCKARASYVDPTPPASPSASPGGCCAPRG